MNDVIQELIDAPLDAASQAKLMTDQKVFLHAGCGPATKKDIAWLNDFADWREVRLDIDAQYKPDIVGDIRDRSTWTGSGYSYGNWEPLFDGAFCSHMLEHLHPYDVRRALDTFRSVLKSAGMLFVVVPNFLAACRALADGQQAPLYQSPAGPIYAHEVLFGKEDWTADNAFQFHKCGFSVDFLRGMLIGAGFSVRFLQADANNLFCGAVKR